MINNAAAINQHTSSGNSKEHSQNDEKPTTDIEIEREKKKQNETNWIHHRKSIKVNKNNLNSLKWCCESTATEIQKHHAHLVRLLKMIAGQLIAQFMKKNDKKY